MNRRGFLGFVIGIVASNNFFARLESEEWQRVILPYRVAFKEGRSGKIIQAPGVKGVEWDVLKQTAKFIVEPLVPTKILEIKGALIFTEKGKLIVESETDPIIVSKEDKLHYTHSLTGFGSAFLTSEELIDSYLRRK